MNQLHWLSLLRQVTAYHEGSNYVVAAAFSAREVDPLGTFVSGFDVDF